MVLSSSFFVGEQKNWQRCCCQHQKHLNVDGISVKIAQLLSVLEQSKRNTTLRKGFCHFNVTKRSFNNKVVSSWISVLISLILVYVYKQCHANFNVFWPPLLMSYCYVVKLKAHGMLSYDHPVPTKSVTSFKDGPNHKVILVICVLF